MKKNKQIHDAQVAIALHGVTARGKRELNKYAKGGNLTRKEAMLAKCYECCCGYEDGKVDCGVGGCPLHPYMPFNKDAKGTEEDAGE